MIITDLDGTVALIDHRRHLVEKQIAFQLWFDALPEEERLDLKVKVSHLHHIAVFVERTGWKPDWDQFYDLCDKDQPNLPVIAILKAMAPYNHIEIFSGRSVAVEVKTRAWLDLHDVPFNNLRMRPEKDYTPDDELKRGWLKSLGYLPLFVLDDRQKVVDMWRREGLTCFQVAPGNF
jgi:hypothetical protein